MTDQEFSTLKRNFRESVRAFMRYDLVLLTKGVHGLHEQAVSHRIAVYLEKYFGLRSGWNLNVDCEYNKHLGESKMVNLQPSFYINQFHRCSCSACCELKKAQREGRDHALAEIVNVEFRPDILVHSRGNDDRNIIAVELKKSVICAFDLAKLRALTTPKTPEYPYGYSLGLFLNFSGDRPNYYWFHDGEMQPVEH